MAAVRRRLLLLLLLFFLSLTLPAGAADATDGAEAVDELVDAPLERVKRQTPTRIVRQVIETTASGSFLFSVASPTTAARERYVFNPPPPVELWLEEATGRVYLRLGQHLNFTGKPSIPFTVLVQTLSGRGLYRVELYEIQVQKGVDLNPIISRYTKAEMTVLYRQMDTLDGALTYAIQGNVPEVGTPNLTYQFIPGMEGRSEGRFRVVPDKGFLVTKLNDAYPGAPKFYDMGVRAIYPNSSSPLTRYGYSFVRVYTTFQLPMFSQDTYIFYLQEDSPPTRVGQILCQSINNIWSTATLTARMRPSAASVLSMDSAGVVSSLVPIDYDIARNQKTWYFTAVCTENATSPTPRVSEVEVTVQLLDNNDNRPYFGLEYYIKAEDTPENTPINTEVFRVQGLDLDSRPNGMLAYTLSGPNAALFNVTRDPETFEAVITLQGAMDYESLPSGGKEYKLPISVTDGIAGVSLRPTSTIVIRVQNVNDNPPTIRNFTSQVDKFAPSGTNIVQIQVPDGDGSPINYYFLASGATTSQYPSTSNNMFTINEITGMVSIGTASLTSMKNVAYVIPIVAIDNGTCNRCPTGSPLRSQTGYLSLDVQGSLSAAPVFDNCPPATTSINYTDNAPIGTPLYTLIARDPASPTNDIEYTVMPNTLNPTPTSYFVITNSSSGAITSSAVLDIEAVPLVTLRNYFWLTVRALNVFNRLTKYCSLRVSFTDINDEAPVFDSDSNIVTVIDMASTSGTIVGNVCAFDPDVPGSDMSAVQYSIVATNPGSGSSLFSMSSSNNLGTLATAGSFTGLSNKAKFELTIEAKNPVPLVGAGKTWNRMTYTVYITNEKDLLPPIVASNPSSYIITMDESVPIATTVTVMTASSPEGATRTYEWSEPTRAHHVPTNSAIQLHFGLRSATSTACTSNTCNVAVVGQFDYQNFNDYYVRSRVSYKDRDTDIGEIYTEVYKRVKIRDMNNRWPDFITRQYVTVSFVLENSTMGTEVTQAFAVDLDSELLYTKVVYALDQSVSDDYRYFTIDRDTGSIRTAAVPSMFDAEGSKTQFELQVNASDSFQSSMTGIIGPNAKTLRLSMKVKDINDNPPVFPRSGYAISVMENIPLDTVVATINATDPDVDDTLRYNIESGDTNYQFLSVVNTGEIKLAKFLDFYVISFYSLIFVATDGKNVAKTQVNITVVDVNNHAPAFIPSRIINITNLTEGESARPIWKLTALDRDNAAIRYSLSGSWTAPPANYFSVDPTTGVLSTTRPLNREDGPIFTFNALASDGTLIGYALITVIPTDLNDNAPDWNYTSLHGILKDSSAVGTPFMQLSVIDPDAPGAITFALIANGSDASEYVSIDTSGLVVTTAGLGIVDRENLPPKAPRGIFTFLVTANDGVHSSVTGTASVTITDINDNPPVFDKTVYNVDIPETTEINDNVFTAAATDADAIDFGQLNYSLPDDLGYFRIINIPMINSGAILLTKQLDYENTAIPRSFVLLVAVVDSNPPPFSVTCTVSINVIDVNDNTPVINFNPGASITKAEGAGSMGFLVSFTATDADPTDAAFIFSILPDSDPYGNLQLTGITGAAGSISVQVALDREVWNPGSSNNAVHLFVLLASDQRGRTGTATLTVIITDINDSPPTIALPNTVVIMENSVVGTIAQPSGLTAEDKDSSVNGGPFTFAQDASAGNNWAGKFALVSAGSAFSIQSAKMFDREVDGAMFILRVLITDRGGLIGTGTVTVIIGDVDDNPILSNGYKQAYVYIYEGNLDYWYSNSTRISLGHATVIDKDDWDRSKRTYTLTTTTPYFEMGDFGEVILKGGTPTSNYTLIVEVKDARTTAWCQFVVTIQSLPNDAVLNSGSMIIDNMDAQSFLERAVMPSTYSLVRNTFPSYTFSVYDYLKLNLSSILSTNFLNTHIFYIGQIPGTRRIIVRYTAHGSPYHFSTRLSSLVALSKNIIVSTLANYGATLIMLPLDLCRLESSGEKLCSFGCRNKMVIRDNDLVTNAYNSTALVGINTTLVAVCGCPPAAKVAATGCTFGACLHDGNCTEVPGSKTFNCSCPEGHEGPRCEKLRVGFSTDGGFLALPSFPGACINIHISLYFITIQSSSNVLLLYTGAIGLTAASSALDRDFLALELINGRPKVTLDLGGGVSVGGLHTSATAAALNDGKWHRIDIVIRSNTVLLKVDGCQAAPTVLDGNLTPPNLTSCQAYWTVGGSFSKLNVGSFAVFLGGRYDIRNSAQYPTILATTGFVGQVAKLRFNSMLYDLYVGSRTWYSSSGVTSNYSLITPSCTWSDGTSKCQNGWCWGVLNGAVGSGSCMCYSGFRLDSNGRCTIALNVVDLGANSYLFYKVKPILYGAYTKQGIKIEIRFRTRATSGTLMFLGSNDPYRPDFIELRVSNSRLVYTHNLGDYVLTQLALPNSNVSDGAWHWVQIVRRLTDVEMIMDNGEDYNYAYLVGNHTSVYNYIFHSDLISVGAIAVMEAGSTKIDEPPSDLQGTCISTVRVNDAFFPVLCV